MLRALAVALLASLVATSAPAAPVLIWQEGESPAKHSMKRHPWYGDVKTDELSGGAFLSHFSDKAAGQATYTVTLPEAGEYELWLRANATKSAMQYRVGDGKWQDVDFRRAIGNVNIAADGKPDLRFIAWTPVAKLKLDKGDLKLQLRTASKLQHHGAVDVIVLTNQPFAPDGKHRPGAAESSTRVDEDGTWAFAPSDDPFRDDALLDLRYLNEKQAGATGYVRLSKDGQSFVRGDGEPIRFWAVCSYGWRLPPEQMNYHVRKLAKLGVNMVRIHANIAGTKEGQMITDVNDKAIDQIQRFAAACKRNGIYTTISPYWYHHKMPESWEPALPGWKKGDMPTGTMFFNETYQNAYKTWARKLYAAKNPHTGVPLAKDPVVAIMQVKNEDSLLFWTSQRIPAQQVRILASQYGDWLTTKYGSIDKAIAAWDGLRIEDGAGGVMGKVGDDVDEGIAGLYIIWHLTRPAKGAMAKRLRDQLQFMAWRQRKFYDDMHRFYRDDLGCRALTNGNNWKSADNALLGDVERWTNDGMDVIAVNRYTGGEHIGDNNGYRIDPGHHLVSRSVLKHPMQLPTNLKQLAGKPMIITESAWVKPNRYQSEGPMLAAAYLSLTGVDALYWFADGEPDFLRDPRRTWWHVKPGDSGYALEKWSCATATAKALFPANALLFRLGYLKQGRPVVRETRMVDELWERRRPIITETETFDPNRDARDLRGKDAQTDVSRLAFLVGPVKVGFERSMPNMVTPLHTFIDADKSTVAANTGELALNWKAGLLTMNTPKAQGVCGFLNDVGGTFKLADVTIESSDHYAAVQVVAIDDQPIARSGKLLVQVGTTARLTGWTTRSTTLKTRDEKKDVEEIVYTGKPPYRVADTTTTLTINNPALRKATLLDVDGYANKDVPLKRNGDAVTITLPPQTMYLIIQ